MKPIQIITDSAVDMPREESEALGIEIMPLSIVFPEGAVSSEDLTPDSFYDRLRAMEPAIPTTSMPAPGKFAALFKEVAARGEEPFAVHISSGLSGTIHAARTGAEQADMAVTVVDTMTLSGGQRFQVLAAANAARKGLSKEMILERLASIRDATEVVYTLETLKYLQHGGRIGRVSALLASVLDIKPLIRVDQNDGKYSTVGKARSIRRAVDGLMSFIDDRYGRETPLWVSVMHGQFEEQATNVLETLRERFNVARSEVLRISPVLGVHTGPGIVGIAAVPMDLVADLL